MHLVICLSAHDRAPSIDALAALVRVADVFVELVNVDDRSEELELERSLPQGLVRPRLEDTRRDFDRARHAIVDELFAQASQSLSQRGAAGVVGVALEGRPERAIVEHLEHAKADLCALFRRPDWAERRESGPKSVGHVARFVVDHAPCPVLLLR